MDEDNISPWDELQAALLGWTGAAGSSLTMPPAADSTETVTLLAAALPHTPRVVARCCRRLLREAPTAGRVWLLLAEAEALRRDGRSACAAAQTARGILGAAGGAQLAWCDLFEGLGLVALGRFSEAHELLVAARGAFHKRGDKVGEARAALALAHHYMELGALAKAEACIATAHSLAADDPRLAWRARVQSADLQVSRIQYAGVAETYVELAEIGAAAGWTFDLAHVHLMQGLVAVQRGTFAAAEAYLTAAEAVYRADSSTYYLGVCQRAFAGLYRVSGRYDEALTAANAALATFQAMGHTLAVGRCHHMLALIHHARNRYDEALVHYRAARVRFVGAGYRQGVYLTTLNQAIIEEARGHFHAALNSYEQALVDGQRLRLASAAGHCHHRIALLSSRLGRYAEAETHFRLARRMHTRTGSDFEAHLCMIGQAGVVHILGRKAQARRLLARARRYFAADDRAAPLAVCEQTLGRMLADEGRYRRALVHYQTALDHFEANGQTIDAALCRLEMGEAYLAADEPAAAQSVLAAAATELDAFPDVAARAGHALGRAAYNQGRLSEATAYWDRAVTYATAARRGIVTENHAGSFFEARRGLYEDALDGWLAVDEPERALAVVEASKGQVLAALLQHRDVMGAAFLRQTPQVQSLWEQAWQVGRELEALRARWPALGTGGMRDLLTLDMGAAGAAPTDMTELAGLADRQANLFERIRRSAASFEVLDPLRPFALDRFRTVADAAWGPDWRALAYYLRGDSVIIFWISRSTIRAYTRVLSSLDRAKLSRAVDPDPEQREVTYAGRLRGTPHPQPPGPRLMADLAQLLIPDDVLPELTDHRRLLIAPHGLLHYLPFHALRPDGGEPLLARATISYAPSLRAWEALATADMAAPQGPVGDGLVVGIGDFRGRAPVLAHAQVEAHDVAKILGPGTRTLFGRAATRERLLRWAEDGTLAGYDVIHLATHALFDGVHPLQSGILLADAALTVPDLFRLRLNARLVTLSACQTALSRLEPGDELLGLREALLFAGARALLVSLWPVDDAATGRLMGHFYTRLLAGARPAEALAAAQRMLYDEGEPVFNWASFVLVG